MKNPRWILSCLVGLAGLPLAPTARSAADDMVAVAVLDFDATDARLRELGSQVALLVTAKLGTADGILTVERQELTKLLGEQELGASGMVDPATAARIGHLTGARVLVTGRVFSVAGETTVALKVIGVETSRVFGAVETFAAGEPPSGPASKLATQLAGILTTHKQALIAPTVPPEDRIARLKQKLAGRTLPSVALAIPEQHLGPMVIDPAAETEIGHILGAVGFTVLTGEASPRADFRIDGEAFSEAGVRRGNLVSCRARVEIKVVAREGDRVALIDRQVAIAVDTAEHIAAKAALRQAAADLAERIADAVVPKA